MSQLTGFGFFLENLDIFINQTTSETEIRKQPTFVSSNVIRKLSIFDRFAHPLHEVLSAKNLATQLVFIVAESCIVTSV